MGSQGGGRIILTYPIHQTQLRPLTVVVSRAPGGDFVKIKFVVGVVVGGLVDEALRGRPAPLAVDDVARGFSAAGEQIQEVIVAAVTVVCHLN